MKIFSGKNYWLYLIISGYCIGILMSLWHGDALIDEKSSNIPLVVKFTDELPAFDISNNYSSAGTPLPFIIISLVCKIIPPSIYTFRIISVIISLICVFIFHTILKQNGISNYGLISLLLFHPYFYRLSFTFYLGLWGMMFGLLAVFYAFKKPSYINTILTGIFISAAVLSQQFYLFLAAAIPLMFIIKNYKELNIKRSVIHITLYFLSQIPYLILFWYWKGLVNPVFQERYLVQLKFENAVFFFIMAGFYYGWLLFRGFELRKKHMLLLLAIPVCIFFAPHYSGELEAGNSLSGLIMHALFIIGNYSPAINMLFVTGLFIIGILVFYEKADKTLNPLIIPPIVFVFAIAFSAVSGERYFVGVIPFMILLFGKRIQKEEKVLHLVIPVYIVLSVGYLWKWLYF